MQTPAPRPSTPQLTDRLRGPDLVFPQSPAAPPPSPRREPPRRPGSRLKLGHALFLCLLLSGIIPLAISSLLLIRQNRAILQDQERSFLAQSAASLSQLVGNYLAGLAREIRQCGEGLLAVPGTWTLNERLREPWLNDHLGSCLKNNRELTALRALDLGGAGPIASQSALPREVLADLDAAFKQARSGERTVYSLAHLRQGGDPVAVLAVPVAPPSARGGAATLLILEAVARLPLEDAVHLGDGASDVGLLLMGSGGTVLWSNRVGETLRESIQKAGVLTDAERSPASFTRAFAATIDGEEREVQMTVSRIPTTEWQVAAIKPTSAASAAISRMVFNTVLSSFVLVGLALLFAAVVSRWVGEPLHGLADTTHAIAAGNFTHRVKASGLAFEMADLAENFNSMSSTLESYVDQLRKAAQANRDLFIGSIRAFATAIDAKDPYTRGHSERVAAVSRAVARYLGFDEEFQQRVWLGALLHDVGKIGVDDRVLKKGELLTAEEYDQMKLHTVIGAEIMGRIEQLKEIVPAIRWHHEAWNGKGYPDGLKGEQIPLIARIVSVADTFDAVTTTRPYQQAYTPEFAVQTIEKLAGTRFDAKVVTAFLSAFESGQIESAIQRLPGPTEEIKVNAAMLV